MAGRALAHQLKLQLKFLESKSATLQAVDRLKYLNFAVSSCQAFSRAVNRLTVKNRGLMTEFKSLTQQYSEYYTKSWIQYGKDCSVSESTLVELLDQLSTHQSFFPQYLPSSGWSELQQSLCEQMLKRKWNGAIINNDPNSYFPSQYANYNQSQMESVLATDCVLFTIKILQMTKFQDFSLSIKLIITQILNQMPMGVALCQNQSYSSKEKIPLIIALEEGVLNLMKSRIDAPIFREICLAFISKKLILRNNFPGYTISLKELLGLSKNIYARESFFFLFYEILHDPIPPQDKEYIKGLYGSGKGDYMEHIINNPFVEIEKILLSSMEVVIDSRKSKLSSKVKEQETENLYQENYSDEIYEKTPPKKRGKKEILKLKNIEI